MTTQHPELDQLPENVRTFWEEKQHELNDTLLSFSYSILVLYTRMPSTEKSGILYLMGRDLWFEDFPKPPLFFLGRSSSYKKTLIQIPRHTIAKVELVKQSALKTGHDYQARETTQQIGFMQRILQLFTSDPLYLLISGDSESGEPFQYAFRELNDPNAWVAVLRS